MHLPHRRCSGLHTLRNTLDSVIPPLCHTKKHFKLTHAHKLNQRKQITPIPQSTQPKNLQCLLHKNNTNVLF